jgi:hypothetical protein
MVAMDLRIAPTLPVGDATQVPPSPPNIASSVTSLDRQILESLGSRFRPSGMLILHGQQLLLFGEKRLRVGDSLAVPYEDREFTLVITHIDATAFGLRLNREEITLPIKGGQ